MIKRFASTATIVAMSATLMLSDGANPLMESFGMNPADTFVRIESSFRPDLQYLVVNVSNTMLSHANRTSTDIMLNYVLETVRKVHEYVIAAGGFMIFEVSSETKAQVFIDAYTAKYNVPLHEIVLLLGSRSMSPKQQQKSIEAVTNGLASMLVASTVISMGTTIPKCQVWKALKYYEQPLIIVLIILVRLQFLSINTHF